MNSAIDKQDTFDHDMQQLHAAAVSQLSPQTLARLRAARHGLAEATPQRGHSWRWLAPASERSEDSQIDWADSAAGPSQSHDQREAYARLVVALRKLPARQREAFTLRVLEELDVADTARAMGCSEGSVKTHLSRARDALQKQLEDFR